MSIKLLIIGHSKELFEKIKNGCHRYEVLTNETGLQLFDYLAVNTVDLTVLVSQENFLNEVSTLESIRAHDEHRDLPVIMVDESPFPIPNNISLAFQSGASDYIRGDVNELELCGRVDNQVRIQRRVSEIQDENNTNKETIQIMDKMVLFMDRADNSFVIFDAIGEIEWVNEGFNRMYGFTLDEFKRKFGRTIFEASKNSEIKYKVERCVKTKKSVSYVAECQTRSGEYKWIQTTFTPILSPSGKVERFIAIETDITKLKETEEALNQKNEYMVALTNHLKSANSLLEQQQKEINLQNKAIESEQKKSEDLLLNILPYEVARQLKSKGVAKPRNYKLATVLFLDFRGFSQLSKELTPKELVYMLDSYFKEFDDVIDKHYIEKIKTIGDAYMCAGGLPLSNKSNPLDVVIAALEIQKVVNEIRESTTTANGLTWDCRIGVHTGPIVAGVVGKKKYLYDIWGDTVNIAARMQEEGEIGKVNVSGTTYEYIKDYFDCDYRGKIAIKNADKTDMYFVNGLLAEYAEDKSAYNPNETFTKILNTL